MHEMTSQEHCYAVRRVNPFLGVQQVIETPQGRATSSNGVVWEIELCTASNTPSHPVTHDQQSLIRYGRWSNNNGLVRRVASSHKDISWLTRNGKSIINAIDKHQHHIPFKLIDTEELWLFDHDSQTVIALLASSIPGRNKRSPEPHYWHATVGENGLPSQNRFAECEALEQQINARATSQPNRIWIQRDSDGNGCNPSQHIKIPADNFPRLLICEDWNNAEESARVCDFIHWIAPSLLTLQDISQQQRSRLEQKLYLQAVSVEHHWHLYPEIIDSKFIKSARVQNQFVKMSSNHQ